MNAVSRKHCGCRRCLIGSCCAGSVGKTCGMPLRVGRSISYPAGATTPVRRCASSTGNRCRGDVRQLSDHEERGKHNLSIIAARTHGFAANLQHFSAVRDREVVGSNPIAPTFRFNQSRLPDGSLFLFSTTFNDTFGRCRTGTKSLTDHLVTCFDRSHQHLLSTSTDPDKDALTSCRSHQSSAIGKLGAEEQARETSKPPYLSR